MYESICVKMGTTGTAMRAHPAVAELGEQAGLAELGVVSVHGISSQ